MDWGAIIGELGGGLSAAVIAALGWWGWQNQRRANELQDARVADHKEHSAQMLENTRTLDTAIRVMEGRNV